LGDKPRRSPPVPRMLHTDLQATLRYTHGVVCATRLGQDAHTRAHTHIRQGFPRRTDVQATTPLHTRAHPTPDPHTHTRTRARVRLHARPKPSSIPHSTSRTVCRSGPPLTRGRGPAPSRCGRMPLGQPLGAGSKARPRRLRDDSSLAATLPCIARTRSPQSRRTACRTQTCAAATPRNARESAWSLEDADSEARRAPVCTARAQAPSNRGDKIASSKGIFLSKQLPRF
jgi:hypothetical protein